MHAFSMEMCAFSCIFLTMCAFSLEIHTFHEDAPKMHKTKFSEIGLASSKGLFFKRPKKVSKLVKKVKILC